MILKDLKTLHVNCWRAVFLVLLISCKRQIKMSEAPVLKQAWRINVAPADKRFESINPVLFGDQALVSAYQDGSLRFFGINFQSAKVQWVFQDTSFHDAPYYNLKALKADDQFILPFENTVFALDAASGLLAWRVDGKGAAEQFLEAFGPHAALQARNDWEQRKSYVLRFKSPKGSVDTLFQINWPDSCKFILRTPAVLPSGNLMCSGIAINTITRHTQANWYLYDGLYFQVLKSGKAYPDNPNGYGITKQPVLGANREVFLCAYDQLFCLDEQGQERWSVTMPRDMLSSAPFYYKNGLYCAMEDGFLYKLNPSSGAIIWKSKASGTPSRVVGFGNQVFLVGGGDGLLYTFDISDGRCIRKMEAPNHRYRENAFFRRFICLEEALGMLLLYDGTDFRAYNILEGQ